MTTKREKEIEARARDRARARGGDLWKFVSPGRRGVPDRIRFGGEQGLRLALDLLYEIVLKTRQHGTGDLSADDVRAIVECVIGFVEFKAPGERPTTEQLRVIQKLRSWGLTVEVVDK